MDSSDRGGKRDEKVDGGNEGTSGLNGGKVDNRKRKAEKGEEGSVENRPKVRCTARMRTGGQRKPEPCPLCRVKFNSEKEHQSHLPECFRMHSEYPPDAFESDNDSEKEAL